MQLTAPDDARSNELSSGPISSQVASRRGCADRVWEPEKSGVRNGLASCRWITDCGTTRLLATRTTDSSSASGSSSSGTSAPAATSISRLRSLAASETSASSASSESREGSRAAVLARMVATPSRRLSCSALCDSELSPSARTRSRSSRTSRAMTWNLVRSERRTSPRATPFSTSRTARASTGMIPSLSRSRTRLLRWAVRVPPDLRWPRRPTDSSSGASNC